MSLRKQLFKGGLQLGATQMVGQGCAFLRNLMLARILSLTNFGIAGTFALTMALLDMLGSLSAEKLLIQAEDGNEKDFQGVAHMILVARGIGSALVLYVCAGPVASLFGMSDAAWAFRWLAFVPLIKSFVHLDMHRLQREMKFGIAAKVDMVSNIVGVLLAWPLAKYLHDYSAMLLVLLVQALVTVAVSHLMAERRYSLCWHKSYASRMARFGWPLMLNGILMFCIFQGDRFVIASASQIFHRIIYTTADLGVYTFAVSLTLTPTLIVASMSTSLMLPVLSRLQNSPAELVRKYTILVQILALVSALFVVSMMTVGGWLVVFVGGSKYATVGKFIGLLAAMQGFRIVRVGPTLAAMARGDTTNALYSNVWRCLSLIGLVWVAWSGRSMVWIAAVGLAGEAVGFFYSVWSLSRNHGISAGICMRPALAVGCVVGLVGGVTAFLTNVGLFR